ncbi:nuclear transport factor 2 family protein [Brevundimonas sp.]|uniref:nuclear transport factor 2 family protein n=1 Tax=Brevundimonas sp. TaxID=1871086 RepID=UPI0027378002|nr:nuclear transport factor 2 family protein [Brevundimonas sp.]MDP3800839.1 nuclear transport factor 2 family protein [Brevundimonas sp.]
MTVRTILIAALTAVGALGIPMAAAAQEPDATTTADLAGDAANMAVLDRFYRALSANDGAAVAELLNGARIWGGGSDGALFVDGGPYDTDAALLAGVFGRIDPRFEFLSGYAGSYLPSGDRVVALGSFLWADRSTGRAVEIPFAHVFTFRDGEITRLEHYTDTSGALDVATPG